MDLGSFSALGTRFTSGPEQVVERLERIKAVLFDWDGVFNNGYKDLDGGSPFSEVDSMGVNLLRFALWLKNGEQLPVAGIITGQHNAFAERFARRERIHGCYMGFTNKPEAFDAFLTTHGLKGEEVAFLFDDVLDLPVAARCGLRILIGRKALPWFEQKGREHAEVITANDGGSHGLREACELLIVASGCEHLVLEHRTAYSEAYQRYLAQRQAVTPRVELRAR